jgi:hypothetical protein
MDVRKRWGRLEYLVKWKGYAKDEWTWEIEQQLENAPEVLADFRNKHAERVREAEVGERRRR